jgi:hypothetical protein
MKMKFISKDFGARPAEELKFKRPPRKLDLMTRRLAQLSPPDGLGPIDGPAARLARAG